MSEETNRRIYILTSAISDLGGLTSGKVYGISLFRIVEAAVVDLITFLIVLSSPLTLIPKVIVTLVYMVFFTVVFLHGLEGEDVILYLLGASKSKSQGKVYILSPPKYIPEQTETTEKKKPSKEVQDSLLWKIANRMEN